MVVESNHAVQYMTLWNKTNRPTVIRKLIFERCDPSTARCELRPLLVPTTEQCRLPKNATATGVLLPHLKSVKHNSRVKSDEQ
jgi:hypothetical protein